MNVLIAVTLVTSVLTSAGQSVEDSQPTKPGLLSAFFGLNNSLEIQIRTSVVCGLWHGADGMPVIFSHEVDPDTLDPKDFKVTRKSGKVGRVDCVTLRPADDLGELRTALLIGEYGSKDDQPAKVEIIGSIMSLDGALDLKGAQADVIPLEAGPTLVLAENLPPSEWTLGGEGECPAEGVKSVVRAVWAGGVTKPGGDEIDEKERDLYQVAMLQADGSEVMATPIAIGDLGDSDNNHDLCIGVEGEPVRVIFPAGALTDPREDLNPDTGITVTSY